MKIVSIKHDHMLKWVLQKSFRVKWKWQGSGCSNQ